MNPDRFLFPDPTTRNITRELYQAVVALPVVSPHRQVDEIRTSLFYNSLNGMARYFDQVMETAGIYNTASFNDDARAFCSIPAQHDVWRRASANWLAGLVVRHIIDENDANEMIQELAVGLARPAYKLS